MRGIIKFSPMMRAVAVIGTVAALVTGVTFAALNSQATLTESTINTATANLTLWNGSSFESSAPGFTITNLVPGTGTADLPFYFKNGGGVPLNLTAHVPVEPSSSGFSGWDNLKVTFKNAAGVTTDTTMQALLAGNVSLSGDPLSAGAQGDANTPGTEGNFTAKFDITPSAVTGSSASVGSFNIDFAGTQPETP
ncbi:MAG: hypothetical protein WA843_05050 [Candidatus Saccharimonadales bacterium]